MHFVSVIHNPINDMTIHRSILNNSKYRIRMITRVPNLWGVIFLSWMFSVERGWYNPGLYDSLCNGLSQLIWGLLCHKQVSISWISNHNPSILCGMWLLMHAIDTCFWHQRHHMSAMPSEIIENSTDWSTVYSCENKRNHRTFALMRKSFPCYGVIIVTKCSQLFNGWYLCLNDKCVPFAHSMRQKGSVVWAWRTTT